VRGNLNSSTLIRGIYRSLLNTGRTYAAFEARHLGLLGQVPDGSEILDPMAGYGGLMRYCGSSTRELSTYNIEFNPPSFYWAKLMEPALNGRFLKLCKGVLERRRIWPRPKMLMKASDGWFPEESYDILGDLWSAVLESAGQIFLHEAADAAVAFLLPIVGRLSSCIQGNVVTHVKKGGLCVYSEWQEAFMQYIEKLQCILATSRAACRNRRHVVRLADAATVRISDRKFRWMVTSPPYPNGRDYAKMFAPENAFIAWLFQHGHVRDVVLRSRLIGCSDVKERAGNVNRTRADVTSPVAGKFLDFIAGYRETRRAGEDNEVYYLPYYCNYFYGIERAYENISRSLSRRFDGYIIVVNNTARKHVIPVAEFVGDTWRRLGFDAEIESPVELSHVGGINPRVKGLSARHMEYTVRVRR